MSVVILPVAILSLALALSTALAVAALARLVSGSRWPRLAAMILVALGTVPPSVFGVLLYGLRVDHVWTISGPGVFGDIGGGPFLLAAVTFTLTWTSTCWGVAWWMSGDAPRWPGRPQIEPHPHPEPPSP